MVKTSRSAWRLSFILPFSPSFPKAWDNCQIYFGVVYLFVWKILILPLSIIDLG
jgi:hypothetical protein